MSEQYGPNISNQAGQGRAHLLSDQGCDLEGDARRGCFGNHRDPTLAKILAIIRDDNPLGDFGIYKIGRRNRSRLGQFTPTADARLTVGTANANTTLSAAILTTFVAAEASPDAIGDALGKLIEAHPWEASIIEIIATVLLTRATSMTLSE